MYDICVVGLGPVGSVTAACLAKRKLRVIGVDVNATLVESIQQCQTNFGEPKLNALLQDVISSGCLSVTTQLHEAAQQSQVIMLAVGTQAKKTGELDLSDMQDVACALGSAFRDQYQPDVCVVARSTVLPGTMRQQIAPLIERESGLSAGVDFHIAANPEYMREGNAIDDFFGASRVVVGADNAVIAQKILELYSDVTGEHIIIDIETAEFSKQVDNSWHALKVAFSNEIGSMVKEFSGNVDETMRIFLADNRLNMSSHYLTPGFAFGGSCLPKDVKGLQSLAQKNQMSLPLINAILPSNQEHMMRILDRVVTDAGPSIGLLGVTFKPHISDVRESPYLLLASLLMQRGFIVQAHDVSLAQCDALALPDSDNSLALLPREELLEAVDTLLICHDIEPYRDITDQQVSAGKTVIDLTKLL